MTMLIHQKAKEFTRLANTQRANLDKLFSSEKVKKILSTKSLLHFLFDRTDHSYLPQYQKLERYQLSAASTARQSVIDCLQALKDCKELSPKARAALSELSKKLKGSLDLAVIIDGLRSSKGMISGVLSGGLNLGFFLDRLRSIYFPKHFCENEIAACSTEIRDSIQELKKGDYYTFVSGSKYHDIQILIRKKEGTLFEIVFYNTETGAASDLIKKIPNLTIDKLSKDFFKKLIMIKLTSSTMEDFEQYIINYLGSSEGDLGGLRQNKNTCAYMSLESLAWDQLHTALDSKQETKEQYKIFIALRNQHVVKKAEREKADDDILALAKSKLGFQERYILYSRVEDIALAEKTFIEEIEKHAPTSEKVREKIRTALPIEKLNILHHELVRALKEKGLTQSEIEDILMKENLNIILRPSYLKAKSYAEKIPQMLIQLDGHLRAMQSLRAKSITIIADRLSFLARKIPLLPTRDFYFPRFITGVLSGAQINALITDLDKMALSEDQVTALYESIEASQCSFNNKLLNYAICKQLVRTKNFDKLTSGILDRIDKFSLNCIIVMLIPLNPEIVAKILEKHATKFDEWEIMNDFILKILEKNQKTALKIFENHEAKFSAYEIINFIDKLSDKYPEAAVNIFQKHERICTLIFG